MSMVVFFQMLGTQPQNCGDLTPLHLASRVGIRIMSFSFLHENIFCGYSLEVPLRDISNKCPQCVSG